MNNFQIKNLICIAPKVNSKLTWGGGYLLVLSSKTTFFNSVKIME